MRYLFLALSVWALSIIALRPGSELIAAGRLKAEARLARVTALHDRLNNDIKHACNRDGGLLTATSEDGREFHRLLIECNDHQSILLPQYELPYRIAHELLELRSPNNH